MNCEFKHNLNLLPFPIKMFSVCLYGNEINFFVRNFTFISASDCANDLPEVGVNTQLATFLARRDVGVHRVHRL